MFFHLLTSLWAITALLSIVVADPNSICYSFGVDFVDEGHYFINSQSSESFTAVSTFEGCNNGVADVLLVHPNGDEDFCTQVPTTPPDTPELSTCPILKSQMDSGEWIILVVGNNGDGQPFAWERGTLSPLVNPQILIARSRSLSGCRPSGNHDLYSYRHLLCDHYSHKYHFIHFNGFNYFNDRSFHNCHRPYSNCCKDQNDYASASHKDADSNFHQDNSQLHC